MEVVLRQSFVETPVAAVHRTGRKEPPGRQPGL